MEGELDLCDWDLPQDTSGLRLIETDRAGDGVVDCVAPGP
jgi:hypothetical protein